MTKFFSKDLADQVGYLEAVQVAAIATDLQSALQRSAAIRKTRGLLSFEEQEAADKAEFLQMRAEGHRFNPDLEAWLNED